MKLALAAALGLCVASSAWGQEAPNQNCGPTPTVHRNLSEKYGERRISAGLDSRQIILELWANPQTGTFTVLATGPRGQSCILSEGQNWAMSAHEPAGLRL